MKIKKVKVEVWKEFNYIGPYTPSGERYCDFRVNLFFGRGRYFLFYYGLFEKRRLKKNTWLLELVLNRNKFRVREHSDYVIKPLMIIEDVEKDKRHNYEKVYVSASLMRRLLEGSTNPESFNELEYGED